jgi:hypothetical protein
MSSVEIVVLPLLSGIDTVCDLAVTVTSSS